MAGTPHNPDLARAEAGWVSPLFRKHGIAHWFSTRDPPPAQWIAQHLAGEFARPARARQVHGGQCVVAGACVDGELPEADAVVSNDPLLVPIVSTADCVPLLVVCTHSRSCAAIHAGWRGIAVDVVGATVRLMCDRFGARTESMIAAIGPCAGRDQYEVGQDVIDAWSGVGLNRALRATGSAEKAWANCPLAARMLLERAGIAPTCIDIDPPCTISNARFASHRREPENRTRMLAGIALSKSV